MPVPKPIAAVLFDLDGTLIDTAPDFVRIVNQLRQILNRVDVMMRRGTDQTNTGS